MESAVTEIAKGLAFEKHPAPMLVFDLESLRILAANEAAFETYRYPRDEFLAMRISDLRLAEDRQALRRFLDHDLPRGQYRTRSRHRTNDGSLLDVEVALTPFEDGGCHIAMAAIHDVSPYKSEIRRLLQEGWLSPACWLPAPVALLRRKDMRFLHANALAHVLLALPRADLCARSLTELIPDSRSRQRLRRRIQRNDLITDFHTRVRTWDGTIRTVALGLRPVPFPGENALAVVLQETFDTLDTGAAPHAAEPT